MLIRQIQRASDFLKEFIPGLGPSDYILRRPYVTPHIS